jgi:prophage antirepressor-like protein
MSSIIPFEFETAQVRTVADEHGDPWFVLRDILDAMRSKTTTTAAVDSINQGLGKGFANGIPLETEGGTQDVTIIAEAAVTYLLSRSNTEKGRRLNRFVHVDVLPTLRKAGRYTVPTEATISPAQQRQLQNAIAEHFPDGKQRPYAWSRFNNHFGLGSYKQLPAAKTEDALAYITQMPGGLDETERERQALQVVQQQINQLEDKS